nr:RDD family protein [Planctomycetales bacterium]NIP70771.1 RDD family protein [Planctomycetales bacterium]
MPAQPSQQLDTTVKVVTPENIAFEYRVAGPCRRGVAYLLDLLLRIFFCAAAALVVNLMFGAVGLEGFGQGLTLVFFFLTMWFYGPLLETYANGQTVGKWWMGLRVLTIDGQPIHGLQAVARNLLRAVDCQPLLVYLLGVLATATNRRFQRLGDLACGTMVVVEKRSAAY